ncbi:MAG: aldehyde ferredoxin oxidoreductase family protein [Deltaproteobacteria bacterium]|nr:aldehyde ferredoxin oxidoreductase family protein [Deltaproteobacteria bacterium]
MTTFAGKLLRIDLSSSTYGEEEIPERYLRQFISARGLSARYLYEELKPKTDPLGPENKIIMSIGVLGSTGLQGFSKWCVMSKSPLTGTIFRSIAGGNFGAWMKHAGYDLIIIEGRAPGASYIYLDKEGVHFLKADDLSGMDPRQLQRKLKERHGPHTESACIGMAGERLVRYAVITSGERTASRGGMGTVMGSKNLKAVSINVPVRVPVPFDVVRIKGLVRQQISILKDHPRRKKMSTIGTPYLATGLNEAGILPVRNFQEGSIRKIQDISGEEFYKLKKGKAGCYQCMTRCGGMREVTRGPLSGKQIDGPEYETIYAFGPLLGITDKSFIIDANALCDYYGIDTISTGACVAFACELFEKGIITTSDTDGLELGWGNKKSIFSLTEKIGKREGIGRILGEGVERAGDQIGEEAVIYAKHIKGLELAGYEPRGIKGYALSMASSNIGGSHMYGRPREELTGKVDPFTEEGKGESIAQAQREQALEDSLIACTFGNSGLDLRMYSEFLTSATGTEEFGSTENLSKIGERIICIERCFNIREGFGRIDDSLPKRMFSEPLRNAGPSTGQVVKNLDKLLDEYYEALGYTGEGIPTVEKLKDLGIEELAKEIINDRRFLAN